MINYPLYIGTLTTAAATLFFLLKFIRKKYLFLRYGFRTKAKVIKLVEYKGGRMMEFGYVPIIKFKGRDGRFLVVKTDFFLERFVTNAMLEIGYEFDIIYEGDDVKGMMKISVLKGIIITYVVVALFPLLLVVMLVVGLHY